MLETTLKKLVSAKTLSLDHQANQKLLDDIVKELKHLPLFIKRLSFNSFPALVITTRKTKTPKIFLVAHLDVVGGSDMVFEPKRRGQKLFGRGVFDMKFAAASFLVLLKELGAELPKYDFGVIFTTDEELGGQHGMKKIVETGYKAKLAILPDGGEDWTVQKSAKGIYQLKIESFGVSGHGSRPWTGENAIMQLMKFLSQLQSLFITEPCGNKDHDHNTINVARIAGGAETNKIPDYAEVQVDIRVSAKSSVKEIRGRVFALAKKYPKITIKQTSTANPYSVDTKNPLFKKFIKLLEFNLGKKVQFINSHGSSDARYLMQYGTTTILLRPIGAGHHTENEWIDLPSLRQFYRILKKFILENAIK